MPNADKIITAIILFVAVALIVLGGITLLSKQTVPDANETPELYAQHQEQQAMIKPFLYGLNGVIIVILGIIVLAGVGLAIRSFMRSKSRW